MIEVPGPSEGEDIGQRFERIEAAERAQRALLERPRFSLRMQVYLAFLIAYWLSAGVATTLVMAIYEVQAKVSFLEIVNEYAIEVEEARRFEKNHLLYGTGLDAAQQAVSRATRILNRNPAQLGEILGDRLPNMRQNIERYEDLLAELAQLERGPPSAPSDALKKELEPQVRRQGGSMVAHAQELIERERTAMDAMISRALEVHLIALVLLLVSTVVIAYVLGTRLLGNVNRFESYAQRIAAGDFTPVTPTRRFGDEFTDLAVATNQMIQALQRHEAGLIQSHKMRAVGTLTAGIAHELNNPLNNILLTAHVLLEDFDTLEDGDRKEMVGEVIEEADRAESIVRNLLDFARESGTQLEPLDLVRLVRDTISLVSNQSKLSGVAVEFSAAEHIARIHGDRQQLQQVFLNLFLNAIAASEKRSSVQVIVLPADHPNAVAVKVIDTGTGIPAHIQDRIFDPFFTTKAQGKGTGLGLSVSQGIIAKHGGRITVSSREGEGAVFTVIFPVHTIEIPVSA